MNQYNGRLNAFETQAFQKSFLDSAKRMADNVDELVSIARSLEQENERLREEYPCKGVMDCAHCEHLIPPDECCVLVINKKNVTDREHQKAMAEWLASEIDELLPNAYGKPALQAAAEAVRDG